MRTVLLLGGLADGMRLEQKENLSRILIPTYAGVLEYVVTKVRGPYSEIYIATQDNGGDALQYMFDRYPQFVNQ